MRFSIITITYNNLAGLETTRASILTQINRDFEWIVVDGASTDGTRDVLQHWQGEIATMISERDEGPYDAMNKGLALARGEYVLFINSGDALAQPETLQNLSDIIRQKPYDFIYGDSIEQQTSGAEFYKKSRSHHFVWWGMFTHHQAMAYRTEFLREFHPVYDKAFYVGADLDLTWRILKKTKQIKKVNFPIGRFAPAGISANHANAGRMEQLTMRHRYMHCPALINVLIMLAQKCVWGLRQKSPKLYQIFRLKSAVSS
ncbi:MAG TPA: glycosyltransferase family 2 protein [Alphaproteobacteria bacterium]|nr:glycosyltransferase family 2 protein [Alphaproteobacteria bacterium]